MLTVKHIRDDGQEDTWAAPYGVSYIGPLANAAPVGLVIFARPGSEYPDGTDGRVLEGGRVFVMNANGQTVANYHLSTGRAQSSAA